MAVMQIEVYRNGGEDPTSDRDTESPRELSRTVWYWKQLFWKVREVSRGCDENGHSFAEILMVKEDADMEVPFVQIQGEYAHLVFTMLPDYEHGYDLSMVEG